MGKCCEWECSSCGKKVCCFDCEQNSQCEEKCPSKDKHECFEYVEDKENEEG
ncbi:MAG: hypothetical protein PHT84_00205 [Candidatus Pacebacteria bacterium]|nr:hypothetical protein [Candidatus Paceibacterota bacterium]